MSDEYKEAIYGFTWKRENGVHDSLFQLVILQGY